MCEEGIVLFVWLFVEFVLFLSREAKKYSSKKQKQKLRGAKQRGGFAGEEVWKVGRKGAIFSVVIWTVACPPPLFLMH